MNIIYYVNKGKETNYLTKASVQNVTGFKFIIFSMKVHSPNQLDCDFMYTCANVEPKSIIGNF